ncbi:MAG: hypothetical protein ACHREM_17450 [Polyangiales bacterium]
MMRRIAFGSALIAVASLARAPNGLASPASARPATTLDPTRDAAPAWMSPRWRGSATFVFPKETDPRHLQDDPWMWHLGDWIEGTRDTSLPSVTTLSGVLKVDNQISDCGDYKIDVVLNQRTVGTVTLPAHAESLQIDLIFPRVAGPTYTLKYIGAEQVASGCGSIKLVYDTTEVTLK